LAKCFSKYCLCHIWFWSYSVKAKSLVWQMLQRLHVILTKCMSKILLHLKVVHAQALPAKCYVGLLSLPLKPNLQNLVLARNLCLEHDVSARCCVQQMLCKIKALSSKCCTSHMLSRYNLYQLNDVTIKILSHPQHPFPN
jgi:hypothetical protein